MIEANPVKFYIARYFFLALALVQWLVGALLLMRYDYEHHNKDLVVALIFFSMGLILIAVFLLIRDKVKRVAVGKNKIVVLEGDRNIRFEWPEVKSLRIVPFFNLYRLKIKGKKNSIYFFPSRSIDPAFGLFTKDTSKMGEVVSRRKKEYGIK